MLEDGALRVAALPHRFAPLALRVEPHPAGIEITELELESDGQTLRASGVVTARELRDVHVAARGVARGFARPEARCSRSRDPLLFPFSRGPPGWPGSRPRRARGSDASLRVPLLRRTFAPIRGRVELRDGALLLPDLEIGEPQAGARLAGRVELAGLTPAAVDLELALRDLALSRNPTLRTDVSGDLRLSGPPDALALVGQVALREASVSLRDETDATLKEIRILANGTTPAETGISEATEAPPDAYERASADLRLEVPRNTWVRGRGAELEIRGSLRLRKNPLQPPVLIGSADVVRGRYTFYRKRFDVRRGSATFDGRTRADPLLDIEAAHRVRDVTVLLYLEGRASSPVVRLASDPPMSESDTLAYLFFGRPADQIGRGQQQGLESAAVALASGVAVGKAGELLARSLPIDTIDVRIDEQGKPSELEVGKYLTDRVFVRYGRTLGPEPEDEVRIELRLTPNWSVGTDASTDDSAGADLIWSLDY